MSTHCIVSTEASLHATSCTESWHQSSTWPPPFVYCVSVAKVAHAGSDTSSCKEFLAGVDS